MRRRTNITYGQVVSIVAIVASMAGTSVAATSHITGKQVKDGTITGKKVRDGTLQVDNLDAASLNLLRGIQGKMGPQGQPGITGDDGIQGGIGPKGDDASAATSWAYNDTGLVTDSADAQGTPNNPPLDWQDPTFGNGNGAASSNIRTGGEMTLTMDGTYRPVVALSGITQSGAHNSIVTDGTISIPYKANISATASLTFLHHDYHEGQGDEAPIQTRLECKLVWGSGAVLNSVHDMGAPVWVSEGRDHGLTTLHIAGNASNVIPPVGQNGNYNVGAECRDSDVIGDSVQWQFVSGSISVLAAQQ